MLACCRRVVGLMTRGREPRGNCTVSTFLCPDYVICRPVYKSDPLYGLDLSLLLKGLTLQRYPVPRVHPGPPIAGLHPGTDSDSTPQTELTPRNLEAGSSYRLSPQSPVSQDTQVKLWGIRTHIQAKGSTFP